MFGMGLLCLYVGRRVITMPHMNLQSVPSYYDLLDLLFELHPLLMEPYQEIIEETLDKALRLLTYTLRDPRLP